MIKDIILTLVKGLIGSSFMLICTLFDITTILGVLVMVCCTGDVIVRLVRKELNNNE